MNTRIFVYGTLRKNFGNHSLLNSATFIGQANTQNKYGMHCRGTIPFVSEGQSIVPIAGEVYEIDAQTLSAIDQLEGCYPLGGNPVQFDACSWYIRKEVGVRLLSTGEEMQAWMYINEQETRHPMLCTGDYADRERLMSAGAKRSWYFAYGSNMNPARMLKRKAYFTRRMRGSVSGYRLVFNKIIDGNPSNGYANLVPDHDYFQVQGLLYEVNDEGLTQLDHYEGVHTGNYVRTTMIVQRGDGESVEAVVYLAHPDKVKDGLQPTSDYAAHLYEGLDVLGEAGKEYLDWAVAEARVTDEARFLTEEDIPTPSEEDYATDVMQHALPVMLNGYRAKLFLKNDTWSTRLVFQCDPAEAVHFHAMGLAVNEEGFFGTKYFQFLRRGILQLGPSRVIVEREDLLD